ncbi:hypothetical protein [Terrimonas alba]|uniref:hypothetical protein n=1 Tax=Terrimonas alba TaxID=3349636 RepID=UPI0035F32212
MRSFLFVLLLLMIGNAAVSQQLSQASFSGASTLTYFSFLTDQDVLIRVSEDGRLLEWGTELRSERNNNYYAPKLQPFMGRVDYYGNESDTAFKGRVKNIGTCTITYYGPLETPGKAGKLKTIGRVNLDYYTNYDNAALKGKLRFIGTQVLEYYSSVENEAIRGKLKSVGNTPITYFSSFDDKMLRGKIKSIGTLTLQWYTSLDRRGLGGSLKSGLYRQNVNGITYILR